jgi:hypothetical protein
MNHVILPDAVAGFGRDRSFEFLAVAPMMPTGFDFIVAAPDHDAGMIAQALDLVDRLLPDVFLKGRTSPGTMSPPNMNSCQTMMPSSSQMS